MQGLIFDTTCHSTRTLNRKSLPAAGRRGSELAEEFDLVSTYVHLRLIFYSTQLIKIFSLKFIFFLCNLNKYVIIFLNLLF